jgi:putative nucleotidyltransferase with HDIG domain
MARGPAARRALPLFAKGLAAFQSYEALMNERATKLARRRPVRTEAMARAVEIAEELDLRDEGTARHCQTVACYAEAIARELELAWEVVEAVRLAGLLHDVGKIGIPGSILAKPGPLTTEEWIEMQNHPRIGASILEDAGLEEIRDWILAHHERPDGEGYPRGLTDAEIPLEAKILAVADAYEAMTNDRCYRSAIGRQSAVAELRRHAGTQFDDVVVEAFIAVLRRDEMQSAPNGAL